jgi:hypothetical protein
VHKTAFKVQAIRLEHVRPFCFDHVELCKSQNEEGKMLDHKDTK